MCDSFNNDSQEQTSNSKEIRERRKLDLSFLGERKIDDRTQVELLVEVPDGSPPAPSSCSLAMILDPPCFLTLSPYTMHAYLTLTKLDLDHDLKRHDIWIKPKPNSYKFETFPSQLRQI